MFCENCGNKTSDKMSFCTKCGTKIKKTEVEMSSGGQNQMGYSSQQVNQRGPVPPVKRPSSTSSQNFGQEANSYGTRPAQPSHPYGSTTGTPVHPSQSHGASSRTSNQIRSSGETSNVTSYGEYLLMFILTTIPIVGIILLIKWAFMDKDNLNKSNFAKAFLTVSFIGFILALIWVVMFGSMMSYGLY